MMGDGFFLLPWFLFSLVFPLLGDWVYDACARAHTHTHTHTPESWGSHPADIKQRGE